MENRLERWWRAARLEKGETNGKLWSNLLIYLEGDSSITVAGRLKVYCLMLKVLELEILMVIH